MSDSEPSQSEASATDPEGPSPAELPPPRVPNYQVSFLNCADEETANRIAAAVGRIVTSASRIMPLDRLDGFTFAADYNQALLDLDRGFSATQPLTPTSEEFATGAAMAATILKDGALKNRVVMEAWFGHALIGDNQAEALLAAHTIFHELSHVSCYQIFDETLPGIALKPIADPYEGPLLRQTHPCWEEYYASNMSAFLDPSLLDGYRNTLIEGLKRADSQIRAAKEAFWVDRDLETFFQVLSASIGSMVKFAGYLLGHADGIEVSPYDEGGHLAEALSACGTLEDSDLTSAFNDLHQKLRVLYERTGEWASIEEFYALNRSFEEMALHYGVVLSHGPDGGVWLNIYE
jgi:hypothetical protein